VGSIPIVSTTCDQGIYSLGHRSHVTEMDRMPELTAPVVVPIVAGPDAVYSGV
jgi:hypothetical protein